ncbi:preprotein translocase subunit SecD [Thiothrix eikelboomii]|uniref:Protein translocase subunit SecD n=1 Tax=Thiothrix eikelboomii TaxID=92487 RepID=A0A1T4XL62_9GAMM|nr:protein translocase subunit SecD [Thiothrix eikelboomii]SKA90287.1 preprotein translocase subunit SecD [Thiothrix eikelboomii]
MNRYPVWKYVMIAIILLIGIIYSIPNFFPSEPAVQISAKTEQPIDPAEMQRFEQVLKDQGLSFRASENNGSQALFRFADTDVQLQASEALKTAVGDKYIVALNLAQSTPQFLRALHANPMYLGLDLRGGVHFLMEVDMNAAKDKAYERYEDEFRDSLREAKLTYLGIAREGDQLVTKFKTEQERDAAAPVLSKPYINNELIWDRKEADGVFILTATMSPQNLLNIERFAIQQNITTLRKRVNELGVAEPVIQQQGKGRIVVQLPGVQDTVRAKEILGATATLEFRLVDDAGNDPQQAQSSGRAPIGLQLYKERDGTPILLKRKVMLTGEYITDASSGFDQNNQPSVNITLDGNGASRFSKATGENVQKLMAVVYIETKFQEVEVDGQKVRKPVKTEEVINVARIQEQLSKRFQITGLDSTKEARDLALLLRAGALAAPLYIIEERTVGPSMGKENIEKGFKSNIWGFVAVVIFMVIYYRVFGVISSISLAVNGFLLFALLSMIQATLTLPGMAAIALTLGMAIDANVLINERIREELRGGASPQVAINAGYERAWGTILDSNLTNLIAGIALFMLGSGPVRGFAVVLCLGILTSMFSAVTVSRALTNLVYGYRKRLTDISI